MADKRPLVSVIIRSHNDKALIGETLKRLTGQTLQDVELLSIDDHSNDGTAEIIASFPQVRRIPSPEGPYRPGKVLNQALNFAQGEFVAFNNSDAIPQADDYLEKLIAPLRQDAGVGAVYGRQICRPDAEILVKKDYERAFGDGKVSANWRFFFSLASSAIRHELLKNHPFNENLIASEDVELAWRLRQEGWKIVYVPEAVVEHSHNYSYAEMKRRYYIEGLAHPWIYGDSVAWLTGLRQWVIETVRDYRYLLKQGGRWKDFRKSPVSRFIQRYQYCRGCHEAMRKRIKGEKPS